jgi:hypothetical protein
MKKLFPLGMQIYGDNVMQCLTLYFGAGRGWGEEANDKLHDQVIADLQKMLDDETAIVSAPVMENEISRPDTPSAAKMSSAWKKTDKQRLELFEKLKLSGLIVDESDKNLFFNCGTVFWAGEEDTDLYFLIAELERENFVNYATHKHGAIIGTFFRKLSGEPFNKAVARKNTKITKSRNSDKIRDIIAEINKIGNNR